MRWLEKRLCMRGRSGRRSFLCFNPLLHFLDDIPEHSACGDPSRLNVAIKSLIGKAYRYSLALPFNERRKSQNPTRRFHKRGIRETHSQRISSSNNLTVHCAASQSTVLTSHTHEDTIIYDNLITNQWHGERTAAARFDNPASPSTFHGFKDSKSLQAAADLYAPNDRPFNFLLFSSCECSEGAAFNKVERGLRWRRRN
jgi:hypothetical protein